VDVLSYAIVGLIAYLLGSIPTGAIVARVYRNVDITRVGSQRTGAANTARVMGLGAGAVVVAGDFAKGALAVWIAQQIIGTPLALALAGFLSVLGHIWSVFLRGRGGRGVVTGLGGLSVAVFSIFVVACLVGCVVIVISRYVSLGSLAGVAAAITVSAGAYITGNLPIEILVYVLVTSGLVIFAHADNIERLRDGTERRLGEAVGPG
jgi:glycerol-3-phosphate acyltransferase PlsY